MPATTEDKEQRFKLIADLIESVANRERERCAKIADDYAAMCRPGDLWGDAHGKEIAKRIREVPT